MLHLKIEDNEKAENFTVHAGITTMKSLQKITVQSGPCMEKPFNTKGMTIFKHICTSSFERNCIRLFKTHSVANDVQLISTASDATVLPDIPQKHTKSRLSMPCARSMVDR